MKENNTFFMKGELTFHSQSSKEITTFDLSGYFSELKECNSLSNFKGDS
jgi:hypothetical protein